MNTCPHCSSKDTVLSSTNKHSIKRLYCKACSSWYGNFGAPKVLLFDIETSRTEFTAWTTGKQYLGWKQIKKPKFIIAWAAKWLFSPDTMSDMVTAKEAKRRNDKRVVKSIYKLISQADFVITHNGDRFDIKELNWQFLLNGYTPNNRYKSIDTLKKCKEVFGVPSYAMDYLCQELGYNGKHHTDMSLWEGAEAGNQTVIDDMSAYCVNDVFMLEDLYLRTRGWMKTHPNFSHFISMYQELEEGEYLCPRCGQYIYKTKFTKKWRTSAGYIYKSCNCPHCGAVLRKTERIPGQNIAVK